MTARPLTVIVPAHNAQTTLRPCLASLFAQSDSKLKLDVIVVVDASTDRTEKIAREFPARCLVTGAHNRGAARNVGAKAARGELILFVDADCTLRSGSLRRVREIFSSLPDVASCSLRFHGQPRFAPRTIPVVASGAAAYRRNVFEALGGFDESLTDAEDADLTMALLAGGYLLYLDDLPLASTTHGAAKRWAAKRKALRALQTKWPILSTLGARHAFSGKQISSTSSGVAAAYHSSNFLGGVLDRESLRLFQFGKAAEYRFQGLERELAGYLLREPGVSLPSLARAYGVARSTVDRDVKEFAAALRELGRFRWGRLADRI